MSIIITHFNYANFVEDALLSLLDQTHENWECVVVDDASEADQVQILRDIVARIGDPRIRVCALPENRGQVPGFFTGLRMTSGDFVCLLDPDDRYHERFLEKSLKVHLNNAVVCPISCTDQFTLTKNGVNTSSLTWLRRSTLQQVGPAMLIDDEHEKLFYIPSENIGWFWSSTSSMMFRRAALKLIEPDIKIEYKRAADSFLGVGSHALGGTLYLSKPLVYRSLHEKNNYLVSEIYSSFQVMERPTAVQMVDQCRRDLFDILTRRGYLTEASRLYRTSAKVGKSSKPKGLFARLRRSAQKRFRQMRELAGAT